MSHRRQAAHRFGVLLVAALAFSIAQAQQNHSSLTTQPVINTVRASRGIDTSSLNRDGESGVTVPNWTSSFVDNGQTYTFTMLGTNPSLGSSTTTLTAILIPVKFTFSNGVVLDPTAPVYGQSKSVIQLTQASPLFQAVPFAPGGTKVGTTQYIDAFQRANFWNLVSTSAPNYHVLFNPVVAPVQSLKVPAYFGYTQPGPGSPVGYVNSAWLDGELGVMLFKLKNKTNTIPIFIVYNTLGIESNGFTFGGYHTAFGNPAQVYAEAGFYDQVLFPTTGDIMTLSHEMAELTDDPFVSNIVPPWNNPETPGQCSNLLEAGDPVNGVPITPITLNGYTYHPEDLTFLPWFSGTVPSTSVNGWYTFGNYYNSPGSCPANINNSGAHKSSSGSGQ